MPFQVKVLADSINVADCRLITFLMTYPRFIHAEFMTHRMFSRNAASSRAIPVAKQIETVETDPVIPIHWGANQRGMQADQQLPDELIPSCLQEWIEARNAAVKYARGLNNLNVHKQIVNRILEPFSWITVIASTTSFEHFHRLRVHPAAEPHFQKLAGMMADAYDHSVPRRLTPGQWHLPLTGYEGDNEYGVEDLAKISVGRCARVSYLTHEGKRDPQADIDLCQTLAGNGHWSPFEHPAVACNHRKDCGNFQGWVQARKLHHNEFIPG